MQPPGGIRRSPPATRCDREQKQVARCCPKACADSRRRPNETESEGRSPNAANMKQVAATRCYRVAKQLPPLVRRRQGGRCSYLVACASNLRWMDVTPGTDNIGQAHLPRRPTPVRDSSGAQSFKSPRNEPPSGTSSTLLLGTLISFHNSGTQWYARAPKAGNQSCRRVLPSGQPDQDMDRATEGACYLVAS